jgi:ketosteroid isomerase-like protein
LSRFVAHIGQQRRLVAPAEAAGVVDTDTIRDLRLQYNHAIESRDANAFLKFLSPTFVEMISTCEVTQGASAVANSYASTEFKDPAFIAYDRQPDVIEVSQNGRYATDRGHWNARSRGADRKVVGGSGLYQAGWVRMDAEWRIHTEAYVQLTCPREPAC